MQDVTIVTFFADGADAPSVAVLEGHVPANEVPMQPGAFKGSAQLGVCYTQVQTGFRPQVSEKVTVQTVQIAMQNWRKDGDWTVDGPSGV